MGSDLLGTILTGDAEVLRRSYEAWAQQPVDQEMPGTGGQIGYSPSQTTLGSEVSVTGPGTFFGHKQRTLHFLPSPKEGWWLEREDVNDSLPTLVSVRNVWTTVRNIVLRSGSPHNYLRMVEHIVALKVGMGLDNVIIRTDSGDPPLFERSSMDLVEAVERAGIVAQDRPAVYVAVKEPVSIGGPNGSFLTFLPPERGSKSLSVDCAVDFKTAIGRQRIRFDVNRDTFRYGAAARTNTTFSMMMYCKTLGQLFADTRNLGYNTRNILIAGKTRYHNEAKLQHNGRSLEAAWHRATLDLLAAIALIDVGRFAGRVISYKAGHALDVDLVRELYRRGLLERI